MAYLNRPSHTLSSLYKSKETKIVILKLFKLNNNLVFFFKNETILHQSTLKGEQLRNYN